MCYCCIELLDYCNALLFLLVSPCRNAPTLRNGAVFLFAYANYANYSFICLLPTR